MKINLDPVFSEDTIIAFVSGDSITVNEVLFDFSKLLYGYSLPSSAIDSEYFIGPVTRTETGHIELTLRFPHPFDASENMRFPEPIFAKDGVVMFPVNTTPVIKVEVATDD